MERLPKAPLNMFTSCFAPVTGCTSVNMTTDIINPGEIDKEKQALALIKVERRVRKHVAAAISRRCDSLITTDEETLLTECEFARSGEEVNENHEDDVPVLAESSGGRSSSSSSTETSPVPTKVHAGNFATNYNEMYAMHDDESVTSNDSEPSKDENMNPAGMEQLISGENFSLAPMVTTPFSPTNVVRQESIRSVKNRFDYMRGHQQFAGGKDPPSAKSAEESESSLKAGSENKGESSRATEDTNFPIEPPATKKRPSPLTGTQNHRRNELAKQILRRRVTNRSGADP